MKRLYEMFFARQLRKPSGFFGKLYMGRFLNRENLRSNQLVLKHLRESEIEAVLEIGFGGGWLIGELLTLTEAKISGIDHSSEMVRSARVRFKKWLSRLDLCEGNAEKLPFADDSFSHVCSVHTAYFWSDAEKVIREIHRVLRPGGRLVLGIHSKAKLEKQTVTQGVFRLYEPKQLLDLLSANGFTETALHSYDPDAFEDNHCLLARKK